MKNTTKLLVVISVSSGVVISLIFYDSTRIVPNLVSLQTTGNLDTRSSLSPEQTISEYLVLSKRGSDLKKLVSELPDSYLRCILTEEASPHSKGTGTRKSTLERNGKITIITIEDEMQLYRKSFEPMIYGMLTNDYPARISSTKLELEGIISQKVKGDDAIFRARLTNSLGTKEEMTFYLHREHFTWKIFFISDLVLSDHFPY